MTRKRTKGTLIKEKDEHEPKKRSNQGGETSQGPDGQGETTPSANKCRKATAVASCVLEPQEKGGSLHCWAGNIATRSPTVQLSGIYACHEAI